MQATSNVITKELLTRKEFAVLAAVSQSWIVKQDREGRGCPRIKCGRSVRYRLSDIRAYLSQLSVTS
jgi:predicted DNA-binding transcriptional regulator AlpA